MVRFPPLGNAQQAEKHEETDDDDDRHSESSDDDSIPSNPAKRSKAIPITKT